MIGFGPLEEKIHYFTVLELRGLQVGFILDSHSFIFIPLAEHRETKATGGSFTFHLGNCYKF